MLIIYILICWNYYTILNVKFMSTIIFTNIIPVTYFIPRNEVEYWGYNLYGLSPTVGGLRLGIFRPDDRFSV